MEANNIKLPKTGTGRSKQITVRDLEACIGDYYVNKDICKNSDDYKHLEVRREWTPMKAYRFNDLNASTKDSIFDDINDWTAEEKYNGWRMMITYLPGSTPRFWGGNISQVNFLPVNYTEHILLKQNSDGFEQAYRAADCKFISMLKEPCILDCEVLVKDGTEVLTGHTGLLKVQEILGSSPDRARMLQKDATLLFKVFDCIRLKHPFKPLLQRKEAVREAVAILTNPIELNLQQFSTVSFYAVNKKAHVNSIWKSGGEGIILKNQHAAYVPGSRLKTHQIKVKRTNSGEIGDDLDVFISAVFSTPEWVKKGLIGGVELSLYIKSKNEITEHIIANVTSIPDHIRKSLTDDPEKWIGAVVLCDGQELSAIHRRLLHANVLWSKGVRQDKTPEDCVMELTEIAGVNF